jgi:hypothetical protein
MMTTVKAVFGNCKKGILKLEKLVLNRYRRTGAARKASTVTSAVVRCDPIDSAAAPSVASETVLRDAAGDPSRIKGPEYSDLLIRDGRLQCAVDNRQVPPEAHLSKESLEELISAGMLYPEEIRAAEKLIKAIRRQGGGGVPGA